MSVQAERYLASFILLAIAFSAGVAVMWPWVKWEQHHRKYERQNADIIYIQDRNNALADLKKNYQEHQAAKAAAQKAKDDAFFETVEEMHRDFDPGSQAS